jgi:hypothetical protein
MVDSGMGSLGEALKLPARRERFSTFPMGKSPKAARKVIDLHVKSPFVFVSQRGAPLSVAGYQRMVAKAGKAARFRSVRDRPGL